jgi:hypothetical protein
MTAHFLARAFYSQSVNKKYEEARSILRKLWELRESLPKDTTVDVATIGHYFAMTLSKDPEKDLSRPRRCSGLCGK